MAWERAGSDNYDTFLPAEVETGVGIATPSATPKSLYPGPPGTFGFDSIPNSQLIEILQYALLDEHEAPQVDATEAGDSNAVPCSGSNGSWPNG